MLYLLYQRLAAEGHHYIPVLNLLRYLTFRSGLSLATAQLTVVAMGSRFIRWMQARQGKENAHLRPVSLKATRKMPAGWRQRRSRILPAGAALPICR